MDTLIRTGKQCLQSLGLAGLLLSSAPLQAGVSADGRYWVIERGDSVYSIAREVFPGDASKQRRFRKELVEGNQAVFQGNPAHIDVGDRLQLPAFAVSLPVEAAVPVPAEAEASEEKPRVVAEAEVVTPDPEDVIGRVVVSVGSMQASNRGGLRKLLRNSKVYKGDTLETAGNSYTQIRMKDGALISLRPNTKLKIREYHFNGREDGTERSFMQLVQGGFRTITGYIGHKNKRNYRVQTGVATIGIRGTHYGLMVCANGSCANEAEPMEDGVYGGVVDGSIEVANESGSYVFNNDQYFHVASSNAPAQELLMPPPVFHGKADKMMGKAAPDKGGQLAEGKGDKAESGRGNLARQAMHKARSLTAGMKHKKAGSRLGALVAAAIESRPPPLVLPDQVNDAIKDTPQTRLAPLGSGMLIAFIDARPGISGEVTGAIMVNKQFPDTRIVLGSKVLPDGGTIGNLPVGASLTSPADPGLRYELILPSAAAGVSDFGGNPVGINWGRWDSNFVFKENGVEIPTTGPLHYVYSDKITSPEQLAALGGLTGIQTYQFAGGTRPSASGGAVANLDSLTVQSDFVNGEITAYDIQVSVVGAPTAITLKLDPALNGGKGTVPFHLMNDEIFLVDATAGCPQCTGRAAASFVGSQAEGLITTYSVNEGSTGLVVQGAAALKR